MSTSISASQANASPALCLELARQHKIAKAFAGVHIWQTVPPQPISVMPTLRCCFFFLYSHVRSIRGYDGRVHDGKRLQALNV